MSVVFAVGDALMMAGQMSWQIAWSLILGFTIAACIEALIRKGTIAGLLPDDRARSITTASALGAASSSCSYAAVAMARSLVRKGGNFTAAMAFQIASTNLVIELGIILTLLIGWQFTAAEFLGGPIMIVVVALLFRRLVSARTIENAHQQADRGLAGSMEGHAAMDMSLQGEGPLWRRLFSADGWTSISHNFVMEWAAILRDLIIGLLIAGAAAAWIPNAFWQRLFLSDHPTAAALLDPLIAPLIAIATFVCSIGNVPLAAVLWNGGITFGGVISFLFADLLIVPILLIYRKYYGPRMAAIIALIFYVACVVAGYIVELVFAVLHLIPDGARHAVAGNVPITWNYTSWLNVLFFVVAGVLVYRFFTTGGRAMLSMMGGNPETDEHHHH